MSLIATEHSGTVDAPPIANLISDPVEVVDTQWRDICSRSGVSDTGPKTKVMALGPKVPRGSSMCILPHTQAPTEAADGFPDMRPVNTHPGEGSNLS